MFAVIDFGLEHSLIRVTSTAPWQMSLPSQHDGQTLANPGVLFLGK